MPLQPGQCGTQPVSADAGELAANGSGTGPQGAPCRVSRAERAGGRQPGKRGLPSCDLLDGGLGTGTRPAKQFTASGDPRAPISLPCARCPQPQTGAESARCQVRNSAAGPDIPGSDLTGATASFSQEGRKVASTLTSLPLVSIACELIT